jgi:hypothetical protein
MAVAVSICAFVGTWALCGAALRLDEGVTFGVAGGALAVVIMVAAWWAPRGVPDSNGGADRGGWVRQRVRAGRNAAVRGDADHVTQRVRANGNARVAGTGCQVAQSVRVGQDATVTGGGPTPRPMPSAPDGVSTRNGGRAGRDARSGKEPADRNGHAIDSGEK